ncbi:hypothetical protein ACS0TY_001953 [Phlomoides rotata]
MTHKKNQKNTNSDDDVRPVAEVWRNPSRVLTTLVNQLVLMAPALAARAHQAHVKFVKEVGAEYGEGGGSRGDGGGHGGAGGVGG